MPACGTASWRRSGLLDGASAGEPANFAGVHTSIKDMRYSILDVCLRAALLAMLAGAQSAVCQTVDKLELHNVRTEPAQYRGTKAVHVTPSPDAKVEDTVAIVTGSRFQDGTIEVDLAGAPAAGAAEAARGF